jgi:hypothetical protein
MKKLAVASILVLAAGCGSSTHSSGTPESFCSQFQPGDGIACDDTTFPPTLKVKIGTGPGTVAPGDDSRFDRGKFLGEFSPSVVQANPPTLAQPGGLMNNRAGGVIYNASTGRLGVRAASEICSHLIFAGHTAVVATAHACTNQELIDNVHAGNIPEGASGLAFGSESSGYAPGGTPDPNAFDNFKASCGGWTYDSADAYQATLWTVDDSDLKDIAGPGMATEIRFVPGHSCGGGLALNTPLAPIACCQ